MSLNKAEGAQISSKFSETQQSYVSSLSHESEIIAACTMCERAERALGHDMLSESRVQRARINMKLLKKQTLTIYITVWVRGDGVCSHLSSTIGVTTMPG
jgi:hypothetical protein